MNVTDHIKEATAKAIEDIYKVPAFASDVLVSVTKSEFEGNYTVVLFSFVKSLRAAPEKLGNEIGTYLVQNNGHLFSAYNVIKGFLNLSITDAFLFQFLGQQPQMDKAVNAVTTGNKIMVEYSSPNTNKPLHLGHLRNNFLGWSVSEILKAAGNNVMKSCIVNDRGIHICKSMIAWQLFADGDTPEKSGMKGDHFVGDYYVRCEGEIKKQAATLAQKVEGGNYEDFNEAEKEKLMANIAQANLIFGDGDKEVEKRKKLDEERKDLLRAATPIMKQTQQMLLDWEKGKPEVLELWNKMNGWVYKGFDETYQRIGTDFDKTYYESETYLPGKAFVERGLEKGVFFKKEDGSVWVDLTEEGLDEKLLLRKDGTSVYITQDLGLANQKYEEFRYDKSIYVIADEQNYHMKVLKAILQKLNMPYADGIFHLSYGMVELPSGRMKSREGTVVDADDLVDEMVAVAEHHTKESGKVKDFTEEELKDLYDVIGLGALKFYLLRVDPKKKMIFNPEESIDFHGFTGPFIQYTHARIKSIFRKEGTTANQFQISGDAPLLKLEKDLILLLEQYSNTVQQAAEEFNPSVIATYAFTVAKAYNTFYAEHSVLNAETPEKKNLRLAICNLTAQVLKNSMSLLGIRVPEKM